ncbi:MAG: PilZ domain-containing protein [Acidobacteriia bacterium]|nr:PilZ domain-containing protein [Terriglobia bacterium]
MSPPKPERRARRRIPASVPVAIKAGAGAIHASGQTRDLSTSGIFLYTDSEIGKGSELEIVLVLPPELTRGEKGWVCCRASVVRVEKGGDGGAFGVAASIKSIEMLPEIPG